MLLALLVAQAPGQPPAAVQWTVLGILALVLGGVGKGVWTLLDRADKRVTANDEARKKEREQEEQARKEERERDLAIQERMVTALIESTDGFKRSTEVTGRLAEGLRETRQSMEQGQREIVQALNRLETRMR